jgi:hypothetical protein
MTVERLNPVDFGVKALPLRPEAGMNG